MRRSCVSGFHCATIGIAIGIGIGIAATFTLVIARHFVGATVDFDLLGSIAIAIPIPIPIWTRP